MLRRERESLRGIAEELNETEARLVELDDRIDEAIESSRLTEVDETLQRLEARCEALVDRRQELIHHRGRQPLSGVDSESLPQFLYEDLGTVTPALADASSCLRTLRHERRCCLR